MRKSSFLLLTAGACIAGIAGMANGTPIQWEITAGGNGHWYDAVDNEVTWDQANTDVQSMTYNGLQGHLATLTSEAENTFVWNNFSKIGYWLGGYQTDKNAEPDGHWAWVTGEEWGWTNWRSGEPNNDQGTEDHLQFDWQVGQVWNDFYNDRTSGGYIVEYESAPVPEPATLLLFGSGLAALTTLRRRGSGQQPT